MAELACFPFIVKQNCTMFSKAKFSFATFDVSPPADEPRKTNNLEPRRREGAKRSTPPASPTRRLPLLPGRNGSLGLALMILCVFLQGCWEDTSIRKYSVAKKKGTAEVSKEQRMLGFIIPRDQNAWYFKMVDDPDKIEKRASDFTKIVESLRFEADGSPKWELGEGWKDELLMQITYAKLTHEADGVSATVTQLPAPTDDETSWQDRVFMDVNRWRDQMSLSKQSDWQSMQPELQEVPSLSEGGARAYYVSLVGKKSTGGMGAPFMNAPFMNPMNRPAPSAAKPKAEPEAGSGSEPEASAGGTESSASSASLTPMQTPPRTLTYAAPEGWNEDKSEAGPIKKAVFKIEVAEGESALVTISTASVKPEMLLSMWFDQLGLEASDEAQQQVLDATENFDVHGVEATLYSIAGEQGDSILVARIPWDDRESLFAKLTGKTEIVGSQKAAFVEFLKSMSW
jgi:hypothetical protein